MFSLLESESLNYDRFYKPLEKLTLYSDNTKSFLKFEKYLLQMVSY